MRPPIASPNWAASHWDRILCRLERDIFPWIGRKPIAEVIAPDLPTCLRHVEGRDALETAQQTLQNCGQVFRYTIATGRAVRDPAGNLRGALPPAKEKHHASITEQRQSANLRAIAGYRGSFVTACAQRLVPVVFVRPGELRKAEWVKFNFDMAEWRIPTERMKMREQDIVPISRKSVDVLWELQALTGHENMFSRERGQMAAA